MIAKKYCERPPSPNRNVNATTRACREEDVAEIDRIGLELITWHERSPVWQPHVSTGAHMICVRPPSPGTKVDASTRACLTARFDHMQSLQELVVAPDLLMLKHAAWGWVQGISHSDSLDRLLCTDRRWQCLVIWDERLRLQALNFKEHWGWACHESKGIGCQAMVVHDEVADGAPQNSACNPKNASGDCHLHPASQARILRDVWRLVL